MPLLDMPCYYGTVIAQSYRIMLEKFPLPSVSTLTKIQKGGIDAINTERWY